MKTDSLVFQISGTRDQVKVIPAISPEASTEPKPKRVRNKPKLIEIGSSVVRIYGRTPGPYTIAWRESANGPRLRAMRSDFKSAEAFADRMATRLANHQLVMDDFGPEDRAEYRQSREAASKVGKSVLLVVTEHADFVQKLPEGITPQELLKFYVEHHPKGYVPRPIPELVDLFLEQKEKDEKEKQISHGWVVALTNVVDKFANNFGGPLHALSSAEINSWLRSLRVGPRSRHNYRGCLDNFIRWSKANGHLPKTWSEMDDVEDPGAEMGEIKILTPEDLVKLLCARVQAEDAGRWKKGLVPFLLLQAFAGIRHEEMHSTKDKEVLLDWRNIDLERRQIYVPKDVAKVGHDRIVPIQPNLAAWLTPFQRPNGPITTLGQVGGALTRTKADAGLRHGKNETRNILRKSFISYRLAVSKNIALVAEEAGNSAGIIRKHYNRPIPASEGERWFSILPTSADVIQLRFARTVTPPLENRMELMRNPQTLVTQEFILKLVLKIVGWAVFVALVIFACWWGLASLSKTNGVLDDVAKANAKPVGHSGP